MQQPMQQRQRRLGEYLQADCGVDGYQVFRGLLEQYRLQGEGRYRLLGEVLMEMGLASPQQIQDALERQGRDLVKMYSNHPSTRH